jgi:HSP20 family molecular chaperone IbpA
MKIDVTKQETERGFVLTAQLPGLRNRDMEIKPEGSSLRIVAKLPDSQVPCESLIEVPSGYTIAQALATYIRGELRIVIPKAAA